MGFLFFGETNLPHSIARTYFFKNLIGTGLMFVPKYTPSEEKEKNGQNDFVNRRV
jgi:hypothetical protein